MHTHLAQRIVKGILIGEKCRHSTRWTIAHTRRAQTLGCEQKMKMKFHSFGKRGIEIAMQLLCASCQGPQQLESGVRRACHADVPACAWTATHSMRPPQSTRSRIVGFSAVSSERHSASRVVVNVTHMWDWTDVIQGQARLGIPPKFLPIGVILLVPP